MLQFSEGNEQKPIVIVTIKIKYTMIKLYKTTSCITSKQSKIM